MHERRGGGREQRIMERRKEGRRGNEGSNGVSRAEAKIVLSLHCSDNNYFLGVGRPGRNQAGDVCVHGISKNRELT